MSNIKAAIVDDEVRNIHILRNILENYCKDVTVAGEAQNIHDAAEMLKNTQIDVLFLDIEMPPHNGFQLLEMFPVLNFEVIFITAFQEYALQAIKFAALDYLLKPIKVSEVEDALEKVKKSKKGRLNELASILKDYVKNNDNAFSKIVIPVNDGYNVIDLKDIIYCEAFDSYTKIQLISNVSHLISKSLKEYEEMLSDKGFYRVHKSFLINIHHIVKIIKGLGTAVVMSDQKNIPISSRKKDEFFAQLKGVINL
ncbi:response regulator [Chitinophaga oryziterrae]|jgi:two-component system LytT family response regulator|uniref:Response regulator n=1 Tax=Chitinophaga oryziterrae TaxID=1031224 RepID=A0A6N8J974_9BACT|nr:LytTR family DNA-binding domain-containing protein [Chitinophaga oryziterrae]MVT41534.1 response regulator [Chitinophaga oryziterrae]